MDNCICPGVNMLLSIYLTISLCYLMPAAVLKLFPIPPPVPRKASGGRPDGDFTSRCQVHRVPPFLGGGLGGKIQGPPQKKFWGWGALCAPPTFSPNCEDPSGLAPSKKTNTYFQKRFIYHLTY